MTICVWPCEKIGFIWSKKHGIITKKWTFIAIITLFIRRTATILKTLLKKWKSRLKVRKLYIKFNYEEESKHIHDLVERDHELS